LPTCWKSDEVPSLNAGTGQGSRQCLLKNNDPRVWKLLLSIYADRVAAHRRFAIQLLAFPCRLQ
jgi:hypothetical protein